MLISHNYKFITIDIPKTGTRSLRTTLLPLDIIDIVGVANRVDFQQHGKAIECERDLKRLGYNFKDYFSFCVVRNPWDRYLSFFKYYKEKAEEYLKADQYDEWSEVKIAQGKSCVELIKNRNDQQILKIIILNNYCQSDFYLNADGEIMVSYIAEFANLKKEFDKFCTIVGVPIQELRHENQTKIHMTAKEIYNQELIDLVTEKEKHVINMNKYII
jgi:hypothetical protein